MNKNHWKIRLLIWIAKRIVHVPIIVNFTPDFMDDMYAVGFAWSPEAAERLRGSDRLIERVQHAEALAHTNMGSRKARRAINRAAKREARRS